MVTQDLINFIDQELKNGKTRNDITLGLVTQGWVGEDIDSAFARVGNNKTQGNTLPSVGAIFQESWVFFRSKFVSILKLMGLALLGYILLNIVFALSIFIVFEILSGMTLLSIPVIVLLIMVFIIGTCMLIEQFIGSLILNFANQKVGIKMLIRQAFPFALPLLFTSILTTILGSDSFFPGIFFSTIFIFVPFAVVLENKKWVDALRFSYTLVKGRFWWVFSRLFVVELAIFLIIFSISRMFSIGKFINVLSVLFIPYFMSYTFVLYKHIRQVADITKPVRMRIVWIFTAIFYCIVIALIILVLSFMNPLQFIKTLGQNTHPPLLSQSQKVAKQSMQIVPLPSSLDTTVYRNSSYGFQINPPKGWKIGHSEPDTLISFSSPQTDTVDGSHFNATIAIKAASAQGLDVDEYVAKQKVLAKEQSYTKYYVAEDDQKIMVHGLPAHFISERFTEGAINLQILNLIVIKNGTAYSILGDALASKWDHYKDILEASLLTFTLNR